MTTLQRLWPVLAAGVTTGVALWFTDGSLDLFTGARGQTRVAMLPTWLELVGLMLIATTGCICVALVLWRQRGPSVSDEAATSALADRFVPLFALAALALPYLPFLPDRLPIFHVLAGPGKYLLLSIVTVQVVWRTLERTTMTALAKLSGTALVFVATLSMFSAAAWRLTGSAIFPGGDEPHYLVIAQSLWRDHDLQIENNHRRGDYEEYYHHTLPPHYQTLGANGAIYSIHPIGLPVVLAPVYAVAQYRGVVAFLVAIGALASALTWQWVRRATGLAGSATFAWAAVTLSAPFLSASFVVYPEMAAALCVIVAFSMARGDTGLGHWTVAALTIAALPWLSTKYAPLAFALLCVCLVRAMRGRTARFGRAAVISLTFAISLAGWFAFFDIIWGSPLPTAPYVISDQMQLRHFAIGVPGLLFDQECGLLAYAPVLLLGFTGLWTMWRRGAGERVTALEIVVVFASLLGTVGAHTLWWGGDSTPSRPIVSGLPLLASPIAWHYMSAGPPSRRAAHRLLLVTSVWITGALVFVQNGFLLVLAQNGRSPLLGWLSPDWHLWALAPSFFYRSFGFAAAFVLVWLATALGARLVLNANRILRPGAATLVATATAGAALMALSVLVPWLFGSRLQPDVSLEARGRIRMLDDFDSRARPSAIIYDPFRQVAPGRVPALFSLLAAAGLRPGRSPGDLLFNARFALPAGQYVAEIRSAEGDPREGRGELGLQIGRTGDPMNRWDVQLRPGRGWQQEFSLPIDIGFIGFRASPSIRDVVSELRVRPVSILDAQKRLTDAGEVLGAASYGPTAVYLHDEHTWLEPAGFWTRGGATSSLTVAAAGGSSLILKVRSPLPNAVVLEGGTWRRQLDLEAEVGRDLRVPSTREDGLVSLRITSLTGISPATQYPGNTDRRFLGCWIQVEAAGDR